MYVAMIFLRGRHWLMMIENENGVFSVRGWHSEEAAVSNFEKLLRGNVVALFLRPYILKIENEKELESLVVAEPIIRAFDAPYAIMGVEIRPDMSDSLIARAVRPPIPTP